MPPLDGNLDLADLDFQRHIVGEPGLQATYDGFPDVRESLRLGPPLRYAPRNRRTLGDNHTSLIGIQGNEKLHTWILHLWPRHSASAWPRADRRLEAPRRFALDGAAKRLPAIAPSTVES